MHHFGHWFHTLSVKETFKSKILIRWGSLRQNGGPWSNFSKFRGPCCEKFFQYYCIMYVCIIVGHYHPKPACRDIPIPHRSLFSHIILTSSITAAKNVNPTPRTQPRIARQNIQCNKTIIAPMKQTCRTVNHKYLWDAVGLHSGIYVDVVGLRGFQVLVHIYTIIMRINKPHHAQHGCLHEDGINDQKRLTNFIPHWGSESWNGKPGIPKRKQKLSLDEL